MEKVKLKIIKKLYILQKKTTWLILQNISKLSLCITSEIESTVNGGIWTNVIGLTITGMAPSERTEKRLAFEYPGLEYNMV